jgi:hypothetical protein
MTLLVLWLIGCCVGVAVAWLAYWRVRRGAS